MNSKQFAALVVITFIVGMVWIIADIIFNTKASIPISEKLQSSLEPINPTFNSRVLEIIESETMSTDKIVVNTSSGQAENEVVLIESVPTPAASSAPASAPASVISTPGAATPSATSNSNITPLITLPATASANPLPLTP